VGIAKAGFGGGAGIVATPLLALTIPVPEAAALLLPLLIMMDWLSIGPYRHHVEWQSLRLLLPAAVVGIALGGVFFGVFSDEERLLKQGIGVLALAFVGYQALRALRPGVLPAQRPPAPAGFLLGTLAGFASTLAHAGGPPVAIYLLPQRLPQEKFVGTSVIFFAVVNLLKLVPYGLLGLLAVGNLATILLLSPLTLVGVGLGIYLNRRFDPTWFVRVVYGVLFLTGLELVSGRSLVGLVF
jgi:uncharacterized membrane protein YfcA